jgi:hypothetical protein
VNFLYFLVQWDSYHPNWRRLLLFPSPVSPLLRPMLGCCCAMSHFLSMTHDVLVASVSSFGNASFCRLPSWAKTKAFNPHHRRRPPFSDSPTPTLYSYKKVISTLPPFSDSPTPILYSYKKVISTLVTLPIIQPCLHFASSQARVSRYQSSTRRRRSLSPASYAYRLSA